MPYGFLDIASTPSVRAAQSAMGSDRVFENFRGDRAFDRFTPNEAAFIAARDSFYMATVSETGWPYVQHRGGPTGFLKVVDEKTLAFADYRGNRQYISVGNLAASGRAAAGFPTGKTFDAWQPEISSIPASLRRSTASAQRATAAPSARHSGARQNTSQNLTKNL